MLQSQAIEVMLVDIHAATWLQETEKEHSINLEKKGQLAAKIPINAFARKKDEGRLTDLFSCISTNSSLLTASLRRAHNSFQVGIYQCLSVTLILFIKRGKYSQR